MTRFPKHILIALLLVLGLAAAAAAGETGVPNRLATAKVGEWATYRLPDGYTQKQTVIARTGTGPEAMVTIRIENIYDGQVVTTAEVQEQAGTPITAPQVPDQVGVKLEIKKENVQVKGRNIVATVLDMERDDDNGDDDGDDEETKWYLSAEIPVFGIIKQKVDDDVVFELVDFGEK